jgi:YD repeat-containing protein
MKPFAGLFLVASLVLALGSPAALAQTCLLFGGKFFCGTQVPGHPVVSACDEAAAFQVRAQAWCTAQGGTPSGWDCTGATPHDDGNVVAHSIAFANIIRSSTCSVTDDTGYGASYGSSFCVGGGDAYNNQGYLWKTDRRLSISCANGTSELISINKSIPSFSCPPGYTQLWGGPAGWSCARPQDCDGCPKGVGNPIAPLTGLKRETEVDYRHASGLELVRHYHSFRFHEPLTSAQAVHTENRLGIVWRTQFDKRIMPLAPANPSYPYAISLPGGAAQYFDVNGVEQYNLGGPSGTLKVVSGVGFYYRTPETTEFYGTDGRLRTITELSGRTLTLTYSDGTSNPPNGGYAVDGNGAATGLALAANRLIRVTDSCGNAISYDLDAGGKIVKMTVPGGGQHHYRYNHEELLTSVTFPDTKVRTYRYNEPAGMVGASLPYALTSIVDENGDVYASFKYDASGRAVSTERAGATLKYQIAYDPASSTVTDPRLTARTFSPNNYGADGVARLTAVSLPGGAGFGAGVKARTYDAAGNLESQTNFSDIKTCYAYLAGRNLETVRVEGLPAATSCASVVAPGAALPADSRKIVTEWHARWAQPTRISEPLRRTTYAYNGDTGASCAPASALIAEGDPAGRPIGVLCSKSIQASADAAGALGFSAALAGTARAWAYTYDATGQVLSADGPRMDVSDLASYLYSGGNLTSVTNAATHVTSITSYNAHGQPLIIVDANGVSTTLTYDARQRLKTRTTGSEITTYDYDFAGQLTKVTLPDGSFLSYDYDAAHRLTEISDNLGNRITYTLDPMGNRTLEEVRDPSSVLAQKRSREYSTLNRLFRDLGAQNQATEYTYDDHGNVTGVKDPLNRVTTNHYDALNRLRQVDAPPVGSPPTAPVTHYGYNGLDALTSVTDPRSLLTGYTVDGLGNLTQQASPDTGTTVNTYDDAGNLLTQTDAKSQLTTYAYDALNRVTLITFHDGSKQAYGYDTGPNGIGRLSSITETNPGNQVTSALAYGYDQHGRVLSETRTVNGLQYLLGYRYDTSGRLDQLTYPSGRTVNYSFDGLGRVSGVTTTKAGNPQQTVVSNVAYHPFGGVKGYTLGNGRVYTRGIDLDGRIASYTLGAQSFAIAYDAASRIELISDVVTPANTNMYGYDNLDRLASASLPGGTVYGYGYDAVGNRVNRNSDIYAYSATSNRLATITPASGPVRNFVFDPNGSTTADGNNTYVYDVRGRMVQATSSIGATSYQVNALGQRIRKTNTLGDTVFHYDSQGKLIAETDPGGALKRELIYLGDIPVGVVQ